MTHNIASFINIFKNGISIYGGGIKMLNIFIFIIIQYIRHYVSCLLNHHG